HDFSFGADRKGDLRFLEEYCAQKSIRLIIIPPYQWQGTIVSSSRIREHLKSGEVEKANELLGRIYYLRGHVEKGFQRGRTIGVPTANIHPDVEFMPRLGVYCTWTRVGNHRHPSITNIGVNPTFHEAGQSPIKIESHIFDFDGQLYGQEVEVYLLHFVRDERKFSGVEELKQQILLDIHDVRRYFDGVL
ncbi:MAG: riboflavin kinase, partial [Bdellovibrio sp.]